MDRENQDGKEPSEVTVVVNIKIKPGCAKDYDEWLKGFLAVLERKVPGYLGTTTIMETSQDSTVRHIIHRFRDKASVEAWESSRAARANGRSRQILYSRSPESDWFRDMV
jgi:antibiotic biosynthesis monooxygenase (ABM) superfamily enzyme